MAIARFRTQHPETELRLHEMSYTEQLHALRCGELDAGLAFMPTHAQGIISAPLWRDSLVALLPKHHPFSKQGAIRACELHNQALIICSRAAEPGLYEQVSELLQTANLDIMATHTATSFQGLFAMVAAQCGIGFAVRQQIDGLSQSEIAVRAIIGRPTELATSVLWTQQTPAPHLQDFIACLQGDPTPQYLS